VTTLPPARLVRQADTHRLIPSRHLSGGDSVLVDLARDDEDLQALFALDAATNDRVLAQAHRVPGIGVDELVVGVPHAHVINAAFCHPHPLGGRFNGPDRGAWYASFEVETAQAEVIFHKTVQLAEIDRFEDSVTYDDYLADVGATFHDLRRAPMFKPCLDPGSYARSQLLAEQLLDHDALGVVYPSARRRGGTCVACFRPALVANVRRGRTFRLTWHGSPVPTVRVEKARGAST
jgi:RES domain-containing protein